MEQLNRKCVVCKKELKELEGNQEPISIAPTRSFAMPSGGVQLYCDKCYKERFESEEKDRK